MKLLLTIKVNDKIVTFEPYNFSTALRSVEYIKRRFNGICYLTIKK